MVKYRTLFPIHLKKIICIGFLGMLLTCFAGHAYAIDKTFYYLSVDSRPLLSRLNFVFVCGLIQLPHRILNQHSYQIADAKSCVAGQELSIKTNFVQIAPAVQEECRINRFLALFFIKDNEDLILFSLSFLISSL